MTMILLESCQKYPTGGTSAGQAMIGAFWTAQSDIQVRTTTPRTGTKYFDIDTQTGDALRRALASAEQDDVLIVGFAHRDSDGSKRARLLLRSDTNSTTHFSLYKNANRGFDAYRDDNGTLLGSTANNVLQSGVWHFIECKVKLHDTTGTVDVYVDGVSALSLTSQDTKNGGTATVFDNVVFRMGGNQHTQDFYIFNEQGTTNNDILGTNPAVHCLFPDEDGNYSQFTGSDGNSVDNYLLVDEVDPDDDTTYVESATTTQRDSYTIDDLPSTSGTVYGVQIVSRSRKTDVGARSMKLFTRLSATDADGAEKVLADSYGWFREVQELDPGGGAWSPTDVNNVEIGVLDFA